jgi:hypothetical protein
MNTASEIVSIPLNKLVASRLNVRKIGVSPLRISRPRSKHMA